MARALVLANGSSMVTLDEFGFVRDFYFPYIGLENHVSGNAHKIGVMVDGHFSWLNDGSWQINIGYKPSTMVGYLVCKHPQLNISIVMEDVVYNEADIFIRQVDIYNHLDIPRDIKMFFHQVFLISENKKRNTAFYDPTHNSVVHYRGRRVFIVNGRTATGQTIDQFSVGAYKYDGHEGTYKDAEDGELGNNGVEHGSVDSVVRFCATCDSKEKTTLYYWISAAKSLDDAYKLNAMVMNKTPAAMIHSTESYWNAWIQRTRVPANVLTPEQKKLFETSLFIMRAHTDNRGSIIASADSEMIEYGKDDYAYMWPRDAAFIVGILDKAGYTEVTKPFFRFCHEVMHQDGYLHHRYNSDRSLGSTWHSNLAQAEWLKDRILQLPIQEDETASVLFAMWNHYLASKDIEFVEELYKPFVEKAAQFLLHFRNEATGLPMPSYDLWEEKIGVSTYTCAAVYGGLMAASHFCEILGKRNHMREFRDGANKIKKATIEHLFSKKIGAFVRFATIENNAVVQHEIVDASSLFGLWYFNMLPQDDPYFKSTLEQVHHRLQNPGATGGVIRYEHDAYFRDGTLPNPWFITTLWEVERRLKQPQVTEADLQFAKDTFDWVTKHQYDSGVLAEQLDPGTGQSKSATPLVWSHAVYVETVLLYIQALERLGKLPKEEIPSLHEL